MTVVNLWTGKPASAAGNDDLIQRLEEMLDRAKAGQITAMGMAHVNADGTIGAVWSDGDRAVPMMAAVSMLQHEFLAALANANKCECGL